VGQHVADEYLAVSLANRIDTAKRAYEWLQERLASTQKEMREAQDKLFRSYQTQDLFVPEGSVSAVSRSISRLNDDLVEATSRRIAIEAALKQAASMRENKEVIDRIPQIAADAQVSAFNTQLVSLTFELARLKEKYKEGHPEVQKVLGQREETQKAKDKRALEILEAMRVEYAQLQKRETELRVASEHQKAAAASQSRRVTELETSRRRRIRRRVCTTSCSRSSTNPTLPSRSQQHHLDRRARHAASHTGEAQQAPHRRHGAGPGPRAGRRARPWAATISTIRSRTRRKSRSTCTSIFWRPCRVTKKAARTSSPRPIRTCARL
jgi:hypothetical protein